jgi:hypothetical protein
MLMPPMFPNVAQGYQAGASGLGDYAPAWGTARRGRSCNSGGINWGGLLVAFVVGFGVMAVMER